MRSSPSSPSIRPGAQPRASASAPPGPGAGKPDRLSAGRLGPDLPINRARSRKPRIIINEAGSGLPPARRRLAPDDALRTALARASARNGLVSSGALGAIRLIESVSLSRRRTGRLVGMRRQDSVATAWRPTVPHDEIEHARSDSGSERVSPDLPSAASWTLYPARRAIR